MEIFQALAFASIVIAMLFIFLTQRQRTSARRRSRREFRPAWTSKGSQSRRRRRIRFRRK